MSMRYVYIPTETVVTSDKELPTALFRKCGDEPKTAKKTTSRRKITE